MTANTSMRSRSGPAIVSPRRRVRMAAPSVPASMIAGASTDASTTSTLGVDRVDRFLRRQSALRPRLDAVEHLIHGGRRSDDRELTGEVLLERLTSALGATDQRLMDLVG